MTFIGIVTAVRLKSPVIIFLPISLINSYPVERSKLVVSLQGKAIPPDLAPLLER